VFPGRKAVAKGPGAGQSRPTPAGAAPRDGIDGGQLRGFTLVVHPAVRVPLGMDLSPQMINGNGGNELERSLSGALYGAATR